VVFQPIDVAGSRLQFVGGADGVAAMPLASLPRNCGQSELGDWAIRVIERLATLARTEATERTVFTRRNGETENERRRRVPPDRATRGVAVEGAGSKAALKSLAALNSGSSACHQRRPLAGVRRPASCCPMAHDASFGTQPHRGEAWRRSVTLFSVRAPFLRSSVVKTVGSVRSVSSVRPVNPVRPVTLISPPTRPAGCD